MANRGAASMDARLHRMFARAGWADACRVIPLVGAVVEGARCYVDEGSDVQDVQGIELSADTVVVKLLRDGVPAKPGKDWRIEVLDKDDVVTDTFRVIKPIGGDQSEWVLACLR